MQKNENNLPTEVMRLTKQERQQHLITFVTFFFLVVTGYMLRMPEEWILKLGPYGTTIWEYRGLVHRIAGTLMIIGSLQHVFYCIFTKAGRSFALAMIPTLKDVYDVIHTMQYYFGFRDHPPDCERFDYREKAEYLALVAGTIIISVTGIFLWTEYLWSKFVLDLSFMIHGMEACLATAAIIVWHFYQVHFKPGAFPMSRVWIDGKMSNEHLKHEHGAMYNRLVAEGKLAPVEGHGHHAHKPKTVGTVVFEFLTYCSILFFFGVLYLLGYQLFFPSIHPAEASPSKPSGGFERIVKGEDMKYRGHFHNTDKNVDLQLANPQFCVTCHGTLPHTKSPDVRSFLNMHNYFMACEVCHLREDNFAGKFNYAWFDNTTDQRISQIQGENGVYGARLIPVLISNSSSGSEVRRMDVAEDPDFIKSYIAQKDTLTPDEQGKAKVIIHKNMAKKPVQCTECHTSKQPYIDFAHVGYSQKRAESLYRTEVADMINRYMQFYLPTMFDPDLMRKQKTNELKMENRSVD